MTKIQKPTKNVKLEKVKKGYFLTIGDDIVKHKWAITDEELMRSHGLETAEVS